MKHTAHLRWKAQATRIIIIILSYYYYLHAGGRLSVFFKKDLIRIRPIKCARTWPRGAAHLVHGFIKKDATPSSRKTQTNISARRFLILFNPQAQSTAHPLAQKLVSMIHDQNERNFFFLPAVMTTSGRISREFLRLPSSSSECARSACVLGLCPGKISRANPAGPPLKSMS